MSKPKKCKHCKEPFIPFNSTSVACSVRCAIAVAKVSNNKKLKQELKKRKDAAKTKGELHKEAQAVFNKFIRLRDAGQPCISCQRHHSGQIHAGHYRSVGAAIELRYNEDNVHAQCAPCNNHKSGNAIDYRINLVKKIGVDRVDLLEGPQCLPKLTHNDIRAVKAQYKLKIKSMGTNGSITIGSMEK